MSPASIDYPAALGLIWDRSGYDRGFISNPFSGPAGPELGLRRTRALLDSLGSPDRAYPIIHVAGSKGKGSTSAFASGIARAAGYRTGLSTSPHMHSFRERIVLEGEAIDEPSFASLTQQVVQAAVRLESEQPALGQVTAFELTTVMALLAFAERRCDIAVVEVGLGGTYDATNVIEPAISVITRLDLEHTQVLGDTIALIAENKAGIIKPGRPVVTAQQQADALEVIERRALENDAPLSIADRDFSWRGAWPDFAWYGHGRTIEHLRSGLAGSHQMENASLAIAAWDLLGRQGMPANDDAMRTGVSSTWLPGRFERVQVGGQEWVLDGAHTPVAAEALRNELLAAFGHPVPIVAGFLRDKHPGPFLESLAPAISELFVTTPTNPRAMPIDELLPIAHAVNAQVILSPDIDTFVHTFRPTATDGTPVVVTGSLALVAEARVALGIARSDPRPGPNSGNLRTSPIG